VTEDFGNPVQAYFLAPRLAVTVLSLVFVGAASAAEVQLISGQASFEFGGGRRNLPVQFQNPSTNDAANARLRYRLYQSSSGASAPVEPAVDWKSISVGPGQTLMAEVECNLPAVRAGSTFQLVWHDGDRKLGTTAIRVFPEGLLLTLSNMSPIGLVDPAGRFTNALRNVGVQLLAEAEEISAFDGTLVLVAPLSGPDAIADLAGALKRRANSGTGVIWIQPARPAGLTTISSAYVVDHGGGHLVIAQESLVSNLATSPLSQLHLVELTELALGRKKLGLPGEQHSSSLTQDSTTDK
jgi:hypothetical protein